MPRPIHASLTGEIWHLSIDDLLAPLTVTPRLGGPGPFVINLSASSAPISPPTKNIAGIEHAHVYQIQRTEDRRMRYRLRLGPFASEDEADAVLQKVRELYPSALTATAEADDLRAIASMRPKLEAAPAPHAIPVLTSVAVPARPAPTAPVPVLRRVEQLNTPLPSLETTQTVRALTPQELEDHAALRWFVIQLSLSEQAFDPDSLPNLDIFSVYRLYAVAGIDQGRTMHALRLGFFSEEIAARAVASYLAAYYDKPMVKRVSSAERDRFADQRVEARKDIGATGIHAIIEITSERVIRETRSSSAVRRSSTPSFGPRPVQSVKS